MVKWKCKSCRKETDHRTKKTGLTSYSDYKILICQECGEKEMVPERVLNKQNDLKLNENANIMKLNWEALQND